MRQTFPKLVLTLIGATVIALAGCGGGGGDSTSTPTPPVPTTVTLSGMAATGAAFVGATVQVIDSTGKVVGTSAPVGDDGTYQVDLASGAVAPFVLVASRTSADGEVQSLVSVVESASVTVANVTPITNLIASRLSASGDPAKLADELAAGTTTISAAEVAATVAEVKAILAPLLAATGTTDTDPLKGSFVVNGEGYDRLLDSISINIVPASSNASNIEIAVRQQLPDGSQPATVSFPSGSTTVASLPAISTTTLVESGTSVKIADFLTDLTACYAVPFEDRVDGVTSSVPSVTGTAANVKAPACRAVFSGGDPANFKSNGGLVGRNANNGGAFASLFRRGATGVVFSQGSYEFTRGNGDVVVGYKSRGIDGSESFDTFVLRKDTVDGKFKLIGNQYNYSGGVTAYQQHRQQLRADQLDYSYRSTGYTVNVDNRFENGLSIYDRVEVTTPRGSTLTLKPAAGFSHLNLLKPIPQNPNNLVGTNFVRLRSVFDNSATTATFATLEPGLFFANTDYSEEDIAAIPSQSTWTFKYFFTPAYLTAHPDLTNGLTQTYKTRARAMTIGELKTRGLAQLSDTDKANIQTESANDPRGVNFEGSPDNVVRWTVPAGALPPTQITLFGALFDGNGARLQGFNDTTTFSSNLREVTTAPCSSAGAGDNHCSNTPVPGSYAPGAYVNSLHLWARESSGREFASLYAFYRLQIPQP
jgi:hypothetical protein